MFWIKTIETNFGLFGVYAYKTNLALVGAYVVTEIVMRLNKWHVNRSKRNEIVEVLFTSDKMCSCANKSPKNRTCSRKYCFYYTVNQMESFINGAQYSLYVCMNVFTSQDLGRAVLKAHERGVKVQVIANQTTAYATGSQIAMLHANGISVKLQETTNFVHHKFCLLDTDMLIEPAKILKKPRGARIIPKTGVVMTGSMNWTFQAMNMNWDNVMITSDKAIVRSFHDEFLEIWNDRNIVEFS